MDIIILAGVLLITLFVLFIVIVFPFMTIINCASANNRTGLSKFIWIVVMVLTWPLGSLFYGLFSAKNSFFQGVSGLALVLALVTGVAAFRSINASYQLAKTEVLNYVADFDVIDSYDLTEEQQDDLVESLLFLTNEINNKDWRLKQQTKAFLMSYFFIMLADDKKLTIKEYDQWMSQYGSYHDLKLEELALYVDSYRREHNFLAPNSFAERKEKLKRKRFGVQEGESDEQEAQPAPSF